MTSLSPRDKECFKIRANVEKELYVSVSPSPPTDYNASGRNSWAVPEPLVIERCFGLLIATQHNAKHAEMNLLEMVSMGGLFLFF